MKECKKCKENKELDQFCNKKVEKDGLNRYCKLCMKKGNDSYYHEVGKIERADYYKQHRIDNKEYFNSYCHNHYHNNKEWYREWNRNKLKTDLGHRLRKITSARISDALRSYNKGKKDRTINYLGCPASDYVLYLESKFKPEWNWDNYGTEWEIDHIKPICKFDLSDEEEMYKCFHYSNTQPLSKQDNREKSGIYLD